MQTFGCLWRFSFGVFLSLNIRNKLLTLFLSLQDAVFKLSCFHTDCQNTELYLLQKQREDVELEVVRWHWDCLPLDCQNLAELFLIEREYQNLNLIFKVVLCNNTSIYALLAILDILPCHLPLLAREEANNFKQGTHTGVRFFCG